MITTSIIIPTYKRKESLRKLLRTLRGIVKADEEVIVVEQAGSKEDLIQFFKNWKTPRFRYYNLTHPSMTKARNLGASHAKGRYLVFFDDDVIVHKLCISNIVKPFIEDSVGAVAGRVIEPHKKIEKQNTYVGRITLLGKFTDGFSSTVKQDVDTVMGCNFSVRKDIYEKIGGSDEKFTGNAIREESDLSLRIKEKGYRIVFEPTAMVTHLRIQTGGARKTEGRLSWYFHFFSNETYFILKHRPWILVPVILGTRWEWIVRCMFGIGREVSLLSLTTPWRGIANGVGKYIKFIKL